MKIFLVAVLLAAPGVRAQTVAEGQQVDQAPCVSSGTAAPGRPAAVPAISDAQQARLTALTGHIPSGMTGADFDGAAAHDDPAAVPAGFSSSLTPAQDLASLPDAPTPQTASKPVPVPLTRGQKIANDAFWSTWWGYHAAWAADFTTTGLILSRGGYEEDPLYTRFGNKNMAGVIGSAAAVHVALSGASLLLHEEAKKRKGFTRYALEAAAITANSVFIGVHASAAAGNVDVLHRMN